MTSRIFTQTFAVVAALIEEEGRFLLVKEAGGPEAGTWNLPAGWLDVGEDPILGAKREAEEETGRDFMPTHLLGVYSLVKANLAEKLQGTPHAIKLVFVGTVSRQSHPLASDVSETRWFTPDEIDALGGSLRDPDIKQQVADYLSGVRFPLSAIRHTIQG